MVKEKDERKRNWGWGGEEMWENGKKRKIRVRER